MTREEYLNKRNTNSISSEDLYETLKLNKTFEFKSLEEFNVAIETIMGNGFFRQKFSHILLDEYRRINDIKYNIITLYDTQNNKIKIY